jgi:hypothetical protein
VPISVMAGEGVGEGSAATASAGDAAMMDAAQSARKKMREDMLSFLTTRGF